MSIKYRFTCRHQFSDPKRATDRLTDCMHSGGGGLWYRASDARRILSDMIPACGPPAMIQSEWIYQCFLLSAGRMVTALNWAFRLSDATQREIDRPLLISERWEMLEIVMNRLLRENPHDFITSGMHQSPNVNRQAVNPHLYPHLYSFLPPRTLLPLTSAIVYTCLRNVNAMPTTSGTCTLLDQRRLILAVIHLSSRRAVQQQTSSVTAACTNLCNNSM